MTFKEFLIRPATNEDIPSIKKVVFGVLQEYNLKGSESGKDKDLGDLQQYYFNNHGYFGVAVETTSNVIVGTFGVYAISNSTCELRKMYLQKSARGKGLGEFIVQRAISIARDKNFTKITLETISPLKEAISLYKKYGFREVPPKEISDRVDQAFELNLV